MAFVRVRGPTVRIQSRPQVRYNLIFSLRASCDARAFRRVGRRRRRFLKYFPRFLKSLSFFSPGQLYILPCSDSHLTPGMALKYLQCFGKP